MSSDKFDIREYQADTLIIGGGIGGLAAAIAAAEAGVSVLVFEKSNSRRSGLAGSGIDHIQSYIPELHQKVGYSVEDFAEDQFTIGGNFAGLRRRDLNDLFCYRSAADVRRLEDWGLQFRFANGKRPGGFHIVPQFHHVPTSYNFAGRDVKVTLTHKALELGVRIVNRCHVRELLTAASENSSSGRQAVGAIGISTREPLVHVAHAKTVIMATCGVLSRLYVNTTSPETFEMFSQPGSAVGSGKLMAARAGASVVDLEFFASTTGYCFNNYSFSVGLPGGSWWPTGRVVDENGDVVVERLYDVDEDDPDYVANYWKIMDDFAPARPKIARLLAEGKKLYFDLQDGTDEEREHIWWALSHEGKTNVLRHHLTKHGVPWQSARFPLRPGGKASPVYPGIWVKDDSLESEVDNLFIAGNEAGGSYSSIPAAGGALVLGLRAGETAAARVLHTKCLQNPDTGSGFDAALDMNSGSSLRDGNNGQAVGTGISAHLPDEQAALLAKVINQASGILARSKSDAALDWHDAERNLQTLLETEIRLPHSDTALQDSLRILRREKAELTAAIAADNPHELSRAFEVLDLFDLAELVVVAIIERKGSIGSFQKQGVTESGEAFGTSIAVSYVDGEITTSRKSNLGFSYSGNP